jgi:hypothetical protein
LSKVSKLAGIVESSATQLRKQNLYDATQVEALRRTIRDEFAITGARCLKAVSDEKLNKAGVAELVRSAAIAVDRAGLLPPSAKDQYFTAMSAYLIKKSETTPSPRVINSDPTELTELADERPEPPAGH